METETVVMSSRRRMVLKPLSPTITSQIKEQNSSNTSNGYIPTQQSAVSPSTDKKKILLQESVPDPITPTRQRSRVLLLNSVDKSLTDSDDSDSDSSTSNEVSKKKHTHSYIKLQYIIFLLCWAVVQYWMIVVAEFGAVFFAVSALIAIYFNTTKKNKKNVLSAYSVFNPQCTPIQGSADPKQLERELIFGGL